MVGVMICGDGLGNGEDRGGGIITGLVVQTRGGGGSLRTRG